MAERYIRSIPTIYDGKIFRSRLEAHFAACLDRVGLRYEYEAISFLLADGSIDYWPDFWIPAARTWVETRGVKSQRGEKQLRAFAAERPKDQGFLIIRPSGCDWHCAAEKSSPTTLAEDLQHDCACIDLGTAVALLRDDGRIQISASHNRIQRVAEAAFCRERPIGAMLDKLDILLRRFSAERSAQNALGGA